MAQQNEAHDLSPGLLRQRRNLMASSLALLFFYYSGATIGSASILGVHVAFANPHAVIHFLWLFQVYYLFRYYQYFRQEPDLLIKNSFYGFLNTRTHKKIQELKDEAFPGQEQYGGDFDFRMHKPSSRWKRKITVPLAVNAHGTQEYGEFEIDIRPFWLDALLAAIQVALNRSYITDYWLPFVLAGVAVLFGAIRII